MSAKNLDEWLDDVQIEARSAHDAVNVPWWPASFAWGVSTSTEGIIAIFVHESDAARFRLNYINTKLNP